MIQGYAQFWFFIKGLGIFSPPCFAYDFSRKMFLMICSINWPNLLVWLPLLLEILGNMCIAIVCFPGCYVINFKINLANQAVFLRDQKIKTKFKFIENEKSCRDTLKAFDDFNSKQQKCMNCFLICKSVYKFWKFIQYTIHWDKTRTLIKFPSDKTNVSKIALFFLSRVPAHHSFTFTS